MAVGVVRAPSDVVESTFELEALGRAITRYGLVVVVAWIGAMKFTGYEAAGIQPLVANSPFMGWMYRFLSVRLFSDLLGIVEIALAVMIRLRSWSARLAASGRAMAGVVFLTTLRCRL